MDFVPWTSFSRIVARYSGDARVSTFPCTEHFRIMAYAQLTWRESLRDIEATLGANASKLYGMGLRQAVRRSTLADANERRDWRIWADFAAVLIRRANKLYADEPLGLAVNIAGKVYALDSSTIDRKRPAIPSGTDTPDLRASCPLHRSWTHVHQQPTPPARPWPPHLQPRVQSPAGCRLPHSRHVGRLCRSKPWHQSQHPAPLAA